MKRIIIAITIIISVLSCSKNNDDDENPFLFAGSDYTGSDLNLRINDFIWKGLNTYYLWQPEVANLQDDRFGSLANTKADKNHTYTTFLKSNLNHTDFFNNLLYRKGTTDRFSYITDDYVKLENQFKGITASTGMDEAYVQFNNAGTVMGIVRYVIPNSDADRQGVQRGDVFLEINGTPITKQNLGSLLSSSVYSFDIYRFDEDGDLNFTGRSVTLHNTATPENPVLITKVIQQGNHRIGYLMYNAFISDYDKALNDAFAYLKNQNITDLVLDLRYNGGGSVQTAIYLASMITGQFSGQVFAKEKWNTKMQDIVAQQGKTINYFLENMTDGTPLNHLRMNKLYVLTTSRTASASELLINGLKPYINVVQIGQTTTGKNQGSITIYDYIDRKQQTKNPKHKWAMQPLVLKIENAAGVGDYVTGLTPTIAINKENYTKLGTLGDPTEPFLSKAIEHITGRQASRTSRTAPQPTPDYQLITTQKSQYLGYNEMYK